jgi:hypothetical protein
MAQVEESKMHLADGGSLLESDEELQAFNAWKLRAHLERLEEQLKKCFAMISDQAKRIAELETYQTGFASVADKQELSPVRTLTWLCK